MDSSLHCRLTGYPCCLRRTDGSRKALTVLELVVATASIGILLSLLLPALMRARESTRRIACTSQLHQVGIAIVRHHDAQRTLPTAWTARSESAPFALGWAVDLLDELEQPLPRPLGAFGPKKGRQKPDFDGAAFHLPLFLCPSDITQESFALFKEPLDDEGERPRSGAEGKGAIAHSREWQVQLATLPTANYVGVYGTVEADDFYDAGRVPGRGFSDGSIVNDRRVRFADLRRGLSSTLLVGERTMSLVPSTWLGVDLRGEDAECRLVGSAMTHPNCQVCDECEFSSRHHGGVNFLWADGHVSLVNDDIDTAVYRRLARRYPQ